MTAREMLLELLPRLSSVDPGKQVDFLVATNKAITVLFKRLAKMGRGADFVRGDLEITITDGFGDLPQDFAGLHGRPWMSGTTRPLHHLVDDNDRIRYHGKVGPASVYELENDKIVLYPAPTSGTLNGKYYKHPGAISDLSQDLPFPGQFEEILKMSVVAINENGLAFADSQEFEILLTRHVDDLIVFRNNLQRRTRPQYF